MRLRRIAMRKEEMERKKRAKQTDWDDILFGWWAGLVLLGIPLAGLVAILWRCS